MNASTHSVPTIGILIMALGALAIMAAPYVLRSSLNQRIDIPPTEQRFLFTWRTGVRLAILMFWLACTALGLGRIYVMPTIWLALSVVIFALLSIGERRRGA